MMHVLLQNICIQSFIMIMFGIKHANTILLFRTQFERKDRSSLFGDGDFELPYFHIECLLLVYFYRFLQLWRSSSTSESENNRLAALS